VGNQGGLYSEAVAQTGREHSIPVTLPPLAVVFLKWTPT
jgi:hypothetical protein